MTTPTTKQLPDRGTHQFVGEIVRVDDGFWEVWVDTSTHPKIKPDATVYVFDPSANASGDRGKQVCVEFKRVREESSGSFSVGFGHGSESDLAIQFVPAKSA